MLQLLQIENFAIINKLEVCFGKGLNIITGETGAGKTIVVQALNLILGDRASSDLIRTGQKKASVTAVFSVKDIKNQFCDLLVDYGQDNEDEIIIHRFISTDGKGKITLNGIPITLQNLKQISKKLIDISSQHEHQSLLDKETHIHIVDQYGNLQKEKEEYLKAHTAYLEIKDKLDKLINQEKDLKEHAQFMRFQLKDLVAADLKLEEEEELETEKNRIKHSVQLGQKVRDIKLILYDRTGSVVEQVGQVVNKLNSCLNIDSKLNDLHETIDDISTKLNDSVYEIRTYLDNLNDDPLRLENINDRLYLLKGLKQKYGGTIEDCINKRESLKKEIDNIENWDETIKSYDIKVKDLFLIRRDVALKLSNKRKQASKKLASLIEKEAKTLGLNKIKFFVDFNDIPENDWKSFGKEEIEFLISPNPGEDPKPLAKIASGGELSRLMLAVKRVLTDTLYNVFTSVFDEVDSGIGGGTADIIGKKLLEVAEKRQVLCITHLPQIAAYGEKHYIVAKNIINGRTETTIDELDYDNRKQEIARMLGGIKITKTSLAHAEELINKASKN